MFGGIVEETGTVIRFERAKASWNLVVRAHKVIHGVQIGDSIAVNGCCLTLVSLDREDIGFNVLEESRRLTNFQDFRPGTTVNLERSLLVDGRLGGHFVTGHIDGTGRIEVIEERGQDVYLKVKVDEPHPQFLIFKGSIAIDGISLTVAEVHDPDAFAVWLIPHTLQVTNLGSRKKGDRVNLEFDLLGKYVERQLSLGSRDTIP